MKRVLLLLLSLFPAVSVGGTLDYPDIDSYFGVDAHIGRIGVKRTEEDAPVVRPAAAPAPGVPFVAPLNHKVYTHLTFNIGAMFNDYVGIEAGKSFSNRKFHKRSSAKSKINFIYIGPVFQYKINEIKGLSIIGTVAIADFKANINDISAKKAVLRLTAGGKYMFNKDFGMRVGTIFHQSSKLKTKKHAASNGVHYMVGLICNL
jgi:long-subunit fatty acid transport protein